MSDNKFKVINEFFDHIYVLTLPRAVDRHKNVEKVLDGLEWSFFYGCDKHDLDYQKVIADGVYDDQLHRQIKRTTRSMNLGEIACALSHKYIYQDIIEKGYKNALILEDDVLPIENSLSRLENTFSQLPNNWEVLMLGYYDEKLPTFFHRFQLGLYRTYRRLGLFKYGSVSNAWLDSLLMKEFSQDWYQIGKVLGGHAYAVNATAAEKFIDYQSPVILQADRLFHYGRAELGINGFALKRHIFTLSELSDTSYINE